MAIMHGCNGRSHVRVDRLEKIPQKEIYGYRFRTNSEKQYLSNFTEDRFLIINDARDAYGRKMKNYVAVYEKDVQRVSFEELMDGLIDNVLLDGLSPYIKKHLSDNILLYIDANGYEIKYKED